MTVTRVGMGALALVALLAGCGAAPEDSGGATTRTVTHALGTAGIPAQPQRVVAADEYAAMTAFTLGITPVAVFGSFGSPISADILGDAGVPVTPAPTFFGNLPLEEVQDLEPDLIVITGGEEVREAHDAMTPIAPVVALPYYDATWQESLTTAGAVFDRVDRAQAVRSGVEERLARIARAAPPEPTSVSVVAGTGGECCFSAARETPLSAVLRDAGFTRPPAQDVEGSSAGGITVVDISPERLGEHDADLVVVPQGEFYDAQRVRAVPTFAELPAVRAGRALQVDGDMWFGNVAFAVDWIATDLEAIAAGRGQDGLGEPADAAERWTAFAGSISDGP